MFKKLITLEWKAFTRSASFGTNVVLKIFMILGAVYFIALFLMMGIGSFYIIKEKFNVDPLVFVNKFLIYYLIFDLIIRMFFQKMPVINIRPFLYAPIQKSVIVNFALGKTVLSFFNFLHAFFFVPFTVVLLINGYDPLHVILWHIAMFALIYSNNFLNLLINNKDYLFYIFISGVIALGALHYYGIFDITNYSSVFFDGLFSSYYYFLLPVILLGVFYYIAYQYYKSNLYLDTGLAVKQDVAETQNLTWLDQFGTVGTFLKNDIKLITRNKRSKTTIIMSVIFLFYGLLFFTNSIEVYSNPVWKIFAAIFVTGGFLFTFGQFVPSWDSSYYQLMMSQNIQYKDYLNSKWWLVVIATVFSTLICSFYIYFGWDVYFAIIVAAIYNIGVNSHLVLLGGAYIKTPIDLSSNKNAFGDKQAFNVKTMLLTIPKLILPMIFYAIGFYIFNSTVGYLFVALAGVLGFAFKWNVFNRIEKVYKTEKYNTIAAYKQKK
ncbi:DUF5687 family protein [Flavobacterium sp. '19STA2R22 D10 B1']|uniref:DUF5687 family protein n=1 Tax=Flavobacterium aerium TaxID=3037261 RepID=UPI00278C7960|nr:DUF5687 family protein [Flavobacterium sp. '19STA2R22 D10 B1']